MSLGYPFLRKPGAKPRMHPNGFVQLDLSDSLRLHVWPDPPIKIASVEMPIHDHIFSFRSSVIMGTLKHTVYHPIERASGAYRLYTVHPFKAVERESPFSPLDHKRYDMEVIGEKVISANTVYTFSAFEFHSSEAIGLTATIIQIHPFDKTRKARVACKQDQEPQLFKRDSIDEEILWSILNQAFPEMRR